MTWPEKWERKKETPIFSDEKTPQEVRRGHERIFQIGGKDVFGVLWTWTWGWFFAEKNGHQTLVVEALICMVQDNYLGVEYIIYIIYYIYICMYYIVNHCWFPGFKLPTSNASRNERNAVEALGAADGPLRVAHHTGGKLMSTSQGAGWEPGRGGRGFHEQKKVERRCRHWVDDVDDS